MLAQSVHQPFDAAFEKVRVAAHHVQRPVPEQVVVSRRWWKWEGGVISG
jgi:hypothetical protein